MSLEGDLAIALMNPGPVPTDGRDLVRYAGGRRALTEQLSGMTGPPKRSEHTPAGYAAASRRWTTAQRSVQRYARGERGPRLDPEKRERIRHGAAVRRPAAMARNGMRMRLRARTVVKSPTARRGVDQSRMRDLPATGNGVYIPPDKVQDIFEAIRQVGVEGGAKIWLSAFFDEYGMPAGTQVDGMEWVHVWENGADEPA